jgi:hypothetical protein
VRGRLAFRKETWTMSEQEPVKPEALASARAKLEQIREERAKADARLASLQQAIRAAGALVDERGVAAVLTPGKDADTALAKARADRDAVTYEIDAIEERIGHLAAAERLLTQEVARLESASDQARLELVKTRLRARIAEGAPLFRQFIEQVVAFDQLSGGWPLPVERLSDFVFKAAGTTPAQLKIAGRTYAERIRAGKEDVR